MIKLGLAIGAGAILACFAGVAALDWLFKDFDEADLDIEDDGFITLYPKV
jgi:hypothetical protein